MPAVSLTLVGFIPKEQAGLSVALLIINGGISAGGFCGFQVNHVDLSPNHSGILMGITNCSTSIFSILSPLIVQFVVTDQVGAYYYNKHQFDDLFPQFKRRNAKSCTHLFQKLDYWTAF